MPEHQTFLFEGGGSIPTSPLQLKIKLTSKVTLANFYKRWHYLGDKGFISTYNFGAFFEGELVGAMSIGPPNAKILKPYFNQYNQSGVFEIKRLAMHDDCPKNSESRFISIVIRLLKKATPLRLILSYADDGAGHVGTIYKASGFKYCGLTQKKNDYWVGNKQIHRGPIKHLSGEWRERSRKHLYIKEFR